MIQDFWKLGEFGEMEVDVERTNILALGQIEKQTVYHVMLRITGEQYLSQYKMLFHKVTLPLNDRIIRTVGYAIF